MINDVIKGNKIIKACIHIKQTFIRFYALNHRLKV